MNGTLSSNVWNRDETYPMEKKIMHLHKAVQLCPFILTSLTGLFIASVSSAGEYAWPEFRGPGKQGHALVKGVPIEWSENDNIAWKVKTLSKGWSSPVVAEKAIILSGSREENGRLGLFVSSYDLASGSLNWSNEIFRPDTATVKRRHTKNSHASSTPILHSGKIYAHFGHFGTAALDLESGKVLWRRVIPYNPVHGNGGSPALIDGLLVFSVDGAEDPALYALDAKSGVTAWRTPRQSSAKKKFSFATPLVVDVDGQNQIISPGSGMVGAYSPADGQLIWQVRYGEGYSVIPRPVRHAGLVFLGSGYDRPKAMAIRLSKQSGDLTDTHIAWEIKRSAPHTPSMIVVGDGLYFISDGGILSCVDPVSGKVYWSERVRGNYSASPVAVGNRIYFVSESGLVTVIQADLSSLKVVASNDLGERSLASPAVLSDTLLFRTSEHLWKITSQR